MKKQLSILLFLLLWITSGVMAGNLPFPQNATYPFGIKAATPNTTKIASLYNAWVNTFYKEGSATVNGATVAAARIDYDDPGVTVSEGVGYGLLIFVYMDGVTETNSFSSSTIQSKFDKLYNYYSAWSKYTYGSSGRKYLMNWKINGFSSITSANSATDAELDVALALLMAHKQWGSTGTINYAAEAENLLSAIYDKEVDGSNLLKPGDVWNDVKNPCYFETAALQLFNIAQTSIGFTNTRNWASVYSASNTFLSTKAQNTTTGLFPDWCSTSGTAVNNYGYDYSWDACRTPWRVAWDYVWWGSAEASTMSGRTSGWLKSNNISASSSATGYSVTGTPLVTSYQSPCFVGGLAASFMTNSANSTNLQTWYDQNLSLSPGAAAGKIAYYGKTLQILYALTMSGNTPNFYGTTSTTAPTLSSAASSVDGLKITLNFTKAMSSLGIANYKSQFQVKVNGTAITLSTLKATSVTTIFDLTLGKALVYGDVVTISYTGTSIQDADGNLLATFSNTNVTNNVSGGTTIIADCEDANMTKLSTPWYSYADKTSTISPVSSIATPFKMTLGGANNTDSAAIVTGNLAKPEKPDFESAGIGFTFKDPQADYDLTGATGFSFWHKGEAVNFSVMLSTVTPDKGYDYSYAVPAHTVWTLVQVKFTDAGFAQPGWMSTSAPTELKKWDPSKITKIQWQVKDGVARSYTFGIDEVQVDGKTLVFTTPLVKTALTTAIATANTSKTGVSEGSAIGNVPSGLLATLTTAITTATNIGTTATTQKQIDDAVIALNAAIKTFNDSKITTLAIDKSALTTAIATANSAKSGVSEGSAVGNVPTGSIATLTTAITTATNAGTTATTQKQIDDAVIALNAAIKTFNDSKITTVALDKSGLTTAIASANAAKTGVSEGSAIGNVPTGSLSALNSAITTATNVGTTATIQKEIDDAVIALNAAVKLFNDSKITSLPVSKTALELTITSANALLTLAKPGDLVGQYPQASITTFSLAIDAANKVDIDPNASQSEVNIADDLLKAAIVTFNASKNTATTNFAFLNATIATASTLSTTVQTGTANGNVSVADKKKLTDAIAVAQIVAGNTNATQTQVNDASDALSAAITVFKNSIINKTGTEIEDAVSVSLYPVLLKETATITVTSETMKAVSFYSITGQIVKSEIIETSSLQVSTSDLTTGVYFVQIKLSNGDVKTIKAIKE